MSAPQLIWNSTPHDFEKRPQVEFVFIQGIGLTDVDFHVVNEQGWRAMKSPAADGVALLDVPPETTAKLMTDLINLLVEKGGYHTIAITLRAK